MLGKEAFDIALELAETAAEQVDIFTEEAHLASVDRRVMVAHRGSGGRFQGAGDLAPDLALAAADGRELAFGGRAHRRRGGERVQQSGGARAVQLGHAARELGEGEIDRPMQLPGAIPQILQEARAQAHQFPQIARGDVWQQGRRRTLFLSKAGEPNRVDRVGLRPHQIFFSEPMRAQRIDQRDHKTFRREDREQILPIVARRLHDDERRRWRPQQGQQLLIAGGVLRECRRALQDSALLIDTGHDVAL